MANLQQFKNFNRLSLIGPCVHTIGLKDLIVPPRGIGELAFYRGEAVPFDKEEFFKKQIEECRELESQAVSAEDRAFWRQAVGRWEEQLRQAQRGKF